MVAHYIRKTRPSALMLANKLRQMGYNGQVINWGTKDPNAINSPEAVALASNKRRALYTMQAAGVPVPRLFTSDEARIEARHLDVDRYLVGRPDYHRKGRRFFLCSDEWDVRRAIVNTASHFQEYIPDAREFRVHIVNDKSIKISEKLGGGVTKNYDSGARFYYPDNFNHKKSLRRVAREAVTSLGLDFGAVDILWKEDKFYVLEVNTAPCLTSTSDTLDRYAQAFMGVDTE